MRRFWKRLRYRLEWLGVMIALTLVPQLSRAACERLGGWLGAIAARLDRRGFAVALANLEAAFGEEYDAAERDRIARESYRYFAQTMLALFWSPHLTRENYLDYFEDPRPALAALDDARGCITGAFHYGNFEWQSLAIGWAGYTGGIITQELKNPLLEEVFRKLRERSGQTTLPRTGGIRRLYSLLRRGGRVALLVDTTLRLDQPTIVIECFGLKTAVTAAPAWLQERTGLPIFPMHCEAVPGGRHRLVVHPKLEFGPGTTHREIAQACWDSFEPYVRKNPAPWLWMYKHWRYRPKGESGYPFYANESEAFEQAAARANYAALDRGALGASPTGS